MVKCDIGEISISTQVGEDKIKKPSVLLLIDEKSAMRSAYPRCSISSNTQCFLTEPQIFPCVSQIFPCENQVPLHLLLVLLHRHEG